MVISEAVQVVGKLTAKQITYLSFLMYMTSMNIKDVTRVGQMEHWSSQALHFSKDGFDLSPSQRKHLEYVGVVTTNDLLSGDIYEAYRTKTYAHFGHPTREAFVEDVNLNAPSWKALMDEFEKNNCFVHSMTSVGQAIAIANMSRFIGKMEFGMWLK